MLINKRLKLSQKSGAKLLKMRIFYNRIISFDLKYWGDLLGIGVSPRL